MTRSSAVCTSYALILLLTSLFTLARGIERERQWLPEGTLLRELVGKFGHPSHVLWFAHWDDLHQRPYYSHRYVLAAACSSRHVQSTRQPGPLCLPIHSNGRAQWLNPYASPSHGIASAQTWRIYRFFTIDGLFDHTSIFQNLQYLPRNPLNTTATMHTIQTLASTSTSAVQGYLELDILAEETAAHGSVTPEAFMRLGNSMEVHPAAPRTKPSAATPALRYAPTRPQVERDVRVGLAARWNDLSNVWFAQASWQLAFLCLKRALYWNPEHTAALLNMAAMMIKLGFERDAQEVMHYYADIAGGTAGGWIPKQEQRMLAAITRGIQRADEHVPTQGATLGEVLVQVAAVAGSGSCQAVKDASRAARECQAMRGIRARLACSMPDFGILVPPPASMDAVQAWDVSDCVAWPAEQPAAAVAAGKLAAAAAAAGLGMSEAGSTSHSDASGLRVYETALGGSTGAAERSQLSAPWHGGLLSRTGAMLSKLQVLRSSSCQDTPAGTLEPHAQAGDIRLKYTTAVVVGVDA